VGVCGYHALFPAEGGQFEGMGHLVGWSDMLDLARHTGSGTCAGAQLEHTTAMTRWTYTAWNWVAAKFNDWNERMGRPDVSSEQIAYVFYLVAADIADSNLEPDTPRWLFRGPAAETPLGAQGREDQTGPSSLDQHIAEVGEATVKSIHLALAEACPNWSAHLYEERSTTVHPGPAPPPRCGRPRSLPASPACPACQ
jgi:hypothetical protein